MTEYGETLARYRFEAGLNQRELGAAIGLDHTQLNKIERGHRPPLGAKYMKPLVRALRLNSSEAENLVDLASLPRKVLDFMDEVADGQAEEKEGQASDTPTDSAGHPAISVRSLPSSTTGGKVDRRIASGRFSEEEEQEVEAALMELIDRFISFKETQRKMQKED